MNNESIFLASEMDEHDEENSLFHVIPVPLEETVSYGAGTSKGPASILKASQQLETFDGKSIPLSKGIFTHEEIDCSKEINAILQNLSDKVKEVATSGNVPVVLGGEHSLSLACIEGLVAAERKFGVIQFDAHADLRDSYENSKYSHACVMRRIFEKEIPFCQIGVRSLSPKEDEFRKQNNILHYDAQELYEKNNFEIELPDDFPKEIFVTIDIDGFDPSVFPSTGTPEPGGIMWYDFFKIIKSVQNKREIIGFDVVEFSPIEGFHAPDFAAARLVYNMMGIVERQIK